MQGVLSALGGLAFGNEEALHYMPRDLTDVSNHSNTYLVRSLGGKPSQAAGTEDLPYAHCI